MNFLKLPNLYKLIMFRFFFLVIIFSGSCKNKEVKYYNHSKWKIPGAYNYAPLKVNPRQVKESLFIDLIDTTIISKGRLNSSDTWLFNDAGDLITRKYAVGSDSFMIITEMKYDDDGFQSKTYSKYIPENENKDTSRTISRLLGNEKFLQTSMGIDNVPRYKLYSFNSNGNIVKIEKIEDTLHPDKVISTQTEYYQNEILQKIESIQPNGMILRRNYFYSTNNFLDSILYFENNKLSNKEIFINNEHGDAIVIKNILPDGKIIKTIWMQYEYDRMGNWTSQLCKMSEGKEDVISLSPINPQFSLIVRSINY
jgi:antitoxin component YwqK of YwqJK toxin-antitoxin module